jgi:hypothetical protein
MSTRSTLPSPVSSQLAEVEMSDDGNRDVKARKPDLERLDAFRSCAMIAQTGVPSFPED